MRGLPEMYWKARDEIPYSGLINALVVIERFDQRALNLRASEPVKVFPGEGVRR